MNFLSSANLTAFQHTAARRRLRLFSKCVNDVLMFQHTAARRRLLTADSVNPAKLLFQHTAARRRLPGEESPKLITEFVSTHSRAEAAAVERPADKQGNRVSTHSRAEAAARLKCLLSMYLFKFQHTAARRRLPQAWNMLLSCLEVSTHSRAEAAA